MIVAAMKENWAIMLAILGRVPPSGVAEQEQAACEAR
jgi:hypothetical protein